MDEPFLQKMVSHLLKVNDYAYKELHQKEQKEKATIKAELNSLKAEMNMEREEKKILVEGLEKSIKEKESADAKLKQVTEEAKQLKEAKIAMEKELEDTNTKLIEYKTAVIAKENENQNQIKGNEKLHSDLQSTKKHNHALLTENSRIHSAMQDLQNTYEEVSKSELKCCFKQNPQEFIQEIIQKFQLLNQEVEEKETIKNKAIQDCIAIMDENDELARQLNYIALQHPRDK